jgi:hypothetical protein
MDGIMMGEAKSCLIFNTEGMSTPLDSLRLNQDIFNEHFLSTDYTDFTDFVH